MDQEGQGLRPGPSHRRREDQRLQARGGKERREVQRRARPDRKARSQRIPKGHLLQVAGAHQRIRPQENPEEGLRQLRGPHREAAGEAHAGPRKRQATGIRAGRGEGRLRRRHQARFQGRRYRRPHIARRTENGTENTDEGQTQERQALIRQSLDAKFIRRAERPQISLRRFDPQGRRRERRSCKGGDQIGNRECESREGMLRRRRSQEGRSRGQVA